MNRRIDITKGPFVSRKSSVGIHVPFSREQGKLRFGEVGIDKSASDAMKGHIPSGEPRVFPFVGHEQNFFIVDVLPRGVASMEAFGRRGRADRIALEPSLDIVIIKLFTP